MKFCFKTVEMDTFEYADLQLVYDEAKYKAKEAEPFLLPVSESQTSLSKNSFVKLHRQRSLRKKFSSKWRTTCNQHACNSVSNDCCTFSILAGTSKNSCCTLLKRQALGLQDYLSATGSLFLFYQKQKVSIVATATNVMITILTSDFFIGPFGFHLG